MENPFKYGCVVSGDHFCERAKAERELRSFVKSGQNVFIQGERRMGKTSLVKKAVSGLRGERLVYICLLSVQFAVRIAGTAVMGRHPFLLERDTKLFGL